MNFRDLPALGAPLDTGTFEGVITKPDGTHCAVVLLSEYSVGLSWVDAMAWARRLQAELLSWPIAAMLLSRTNRVLPKRGHWTGTETGREFAWYCGSSGERILLHKSRKCCSAAVRLISLDIEAVYARRDASDELRQLG